jgi:hypothetical protein
MIVEQIETNAPLAAANAPFSNAEEGASNFVSRPFSSLAAAAQHTEKNVSFGSAKIVEIRA